MLGNVLLATGGVLALRKAWQARRKGSNAQESRQLRRSALLAEQRQHFDSKERRTSWNS